MYPDSERMRIKKFGVASGWIAMSDLISLRMHEIPKAVVLIPFKKLHDAEVRRDLVSGVLIRGQFFR